MLAYRLEVWTMLIMQCLLMVAQGFFWRAVYGDTEAVHGVTGNTMITYAMVSTLMSSLYYMGVEDRITDAVKSGSIATDMIKPINLFSLYFAEDVGNIIFNFFTSTIPTFVVGLLVFGLPMPASPLHFVFFLISFALGYGINWTFSAIFALIAFSQINLGPAFSIKYHFVNMLSGAMIPLWFFPQWLQTALYYLPFVYMFQEPLSIFIGKYDTGECIEKLIIQAIWFTVLALIFVYAQSKATKKVLVQGG